MHSSHIFCSNCGVKNQRNAGFCFNCGNQLTHLDAAANTFPTPDNVAGSGQQVPAPPIQVLAPPRALAEAVLPQGAKPPITNPGDLTPSDINNATGFLPTNTISNNGIASCTRLGEAAWGRSTWAKTCN